MYVSCSFITFLPFIKRLKSLARHKTEVQTLPASSIHKKGSNVKIKVDETESCPRELIFSMLEIYGEHKGKWDISTPGTRGDPGS